MIDKKPHSADYFGDTRDFWWNSDFLELMAARWNLGTVRSALDVGCGIGHWGRCLAPLLRTGCTLVGIDREARWVEEATKRSQGIANVIASFLQAEAERLPFPDNSFDMVTCQTVLIHVKDPLSVIREMLRVLVPGGLIVLAEPNNLATHFNSIELRRPISDLIGILEFRMICEHGKTDLGEGNNSAGQFVAGWLSELHVSGIESYLSDKTIMLIPPYKSAHESAFIRETEEMSERQFWMWSREDTLRFFMAGGGRREAFEHHWSEALSREEEFLRDIQCRNLRATFSPNCLLVSGRKKEAEQAMDSNPH